MDQTSSGLVGMAYYSNGGNAVVQKLVAVDKTADRSVILADPQDPDKMPAIGFVFKISGGKVFVKSNGDMEGFTGLTRGELYTPAGEKRYVSITASGRLSVRKTPPEKKS
tara:strand:+ start:1754 stop:2083 length:330 start_codon:yes stop_codon:yes gene_type:complete